jgi:hypothetical protein
MPINKEEHMTPIDLTGKRALVTGGNVGPDLMD